MKRLKAILAWHRNDEITKAVLAVAMALVTTLATGVAVRDQLPAGFGFSAATAPKKTPALLEKGKAAFGINCASCHGDTGAGDGQAAATLEVKPRNFAKGKFKNGAKVTDIFGTLEKGVPGSQMVAFTHLAEEGAAQV